MKKLFFAVAAMALVACGGNQSSASLDAAQTDSLNAMVESLQNAAPEVQAAVENDAELKELVEKAAKNELNDEEKATLWKKLKAIGTNVIMGDETVTTAATEAASEIQNAGAEELTGAAAEAAQAIGGEEAAAKVNEAAERIEEAKQTVEAVQGAANAAQDLMNGLKR